MSDPICQLDYTDLTGSDIGPSIDDIPSWSKCAALCSLDASCDSFTWNSVNQKCFLKTGIPTQNYDAGSFSGTESCLNPGNNKFPLDKGAFLFFIV